MSGPQGYALQKCTKDRHHIQISRRLMYCRLSRINLNLDFLTQVLVQQSSTFFCPISWKLIHQTDLKSVSYLKILSLISTHNEHFITVEFLISSSVFGIQLLDGCCSLELDVVGNVKHELSVEKGLWMQGLQGIVD